MSAPPSERDLPYPPRSPAIQVIQVSNPVAGLRTPELTPFKLTDPGRSTREKSVVVDDQPRVCFRSPSAGSYRTNYPLAAQPTRPMMPSNVGGDRNALRMPIMSDGLRSWSYELFDCFSDLPTCMYGLWSTTHHYLPFSSLHFANLRRPVMLLLLLCLLAEQATVYPPRHAWCTPSRAG